MPLGARSATFPDMESHDPFAPHPPTAFPATARAVREACGDAPLDAASFATPLVPCALAACRGTCCTHGVTLNAEEALVLGQLVARRGALLRAAAPALPDAPLVRDADGVVRTALLPRAMHGAVRGYPAHFPDAACAFLAPDARCALQVLAESEGRHPWHYKPLACWLHPIAVGADAIRLPDAATDPYPGGFASCTPCGRAAPDGPGARPAAAVLAAELRHLGSWLGRTLDAAEMARPGSTE